MKLINYEEYKNKLLEVRDSIPLTVPAASYELMREKPYTHGMAMRGGIHKALKCLEQCQNVSDVVPASQERIYKDLLDALLEDVQSLETTYVDACCMCTKGECDNCNLNTFTDALLKIIERATERKKRLTD